MLMVFHCMMKPTRIILSSLKTMLILLDSEIKRVKGVGDANVLGQDYSMRIWLKPDVMAQYKTGSY